MSNTPVSINSETLNISLDKNTLLPDSICYSICTFKAVQTEVDPLDAKTPALVMLEIKRKWMQMLNF